MSRSWNRSELRLDWIQKFHNVNENNKAQKWDKSLDDVFERIQLTKLNKKLFFLKPKSKLNLCRRLLAKIERNYKSTYARFSRGPKNIKMDFKKGIFWRHGDVIDRIMVSNNSNIVVVYLGL